jgi:hypothetical protein
MLKGDNDEDESVLGNEHQQQLNEYPPSCIVSPDFNDVPQATVQLLPFRVVDYSGAADVSKFFIVDRTGQLVVWFECHLLFDLDPSSTVFIVNILSSSFNHFPHDFFSYLIKFVFFNLFFFFNQIQTI